MARPFLPVDELHHREYRLRLNDADADLINALARKMGLAPAALIRSLVKARLGQISPDPAPTRNLHAKRA